MNLPPLILLVVLFWSFVSSGEAAVKSYYVNYSSTVDPMVLRAFDESIIHPEARTDLTLARAAGHRSYAYMSLVEMSSTAHYRDRITAKNVRLMGKNDAWESHLLDIAAPGWKPLFLQLADEAAVQGFDGFFIDTADSVELLAAVAPGRAAEFKAAAVDIIKAVKAAHPSKRIILNRGFQLLPQLQDQVSGVMIESLYQSFEVAKKTYQPTPASDTVALLAQANRWKAAGLEIYVLDYARPGDQKTARATAEKINAQGFNAFISTPELGGYSLAPLNRVKRRLLCIYGNAGESGADESMLPIDCPTANVAQMPLEWLGYEVDYMNFHLESFPENAETTYHGVIIDADLSVPPDKEDDLVSWLIAQKKVGTKILFLGGMPIQGERDQIRLFDALGMQLHTDVKFKDVKFDVTSSITGFEMNLRLYSESVFALTGPTNAIRHISLSAKDLADKPYVLDQVFTTSWGGMALFPYLHFRRPDTTTLWFLDPFVYLEQVFGKATWPVPDITTRDGSRMFFAHIDGDGFRHESDAEANKFSSQIVFDRIIQKYPLPITVSVIEAEMRGLIEDQTNDVETAKLRDIARKIYALPHVQAGTHGYSHPFFWSADSKNKDDYENQTLLLKPPHTITNVDFVREIVGSAQYIQSELLPPGKKVELMQWSGDCRPTEEGLRVTRLAGLASINGGETTISRRNPTLTKVAARGIPWGSEYQIYAGCQNENVYRDQKEDGTLLFPGGFINVIDTFRRLETPRRLKPVNVYFHFYSGDYRTSTEALRRIFDWAVSQPLQAITTRQYTEIAKDASDTRIFESARNEFVIVNNGDLRTFRLPLGRLVPDMARSEHVTGWLQDTNAIYVHTDGNGKVKLALAESPSPRLRLLSSTMPIIFSTFQEKMVAFTVKDYRAGRVRFGGIKPATKVAVQINNQTVDKVAGKEGDILLELNNEATVILTILDGG